MMVQQESNRRGRGEFARRTARDWAARSVLALCLVILGYFGTATSLANVVAKVEPASAYALAPSNGVIMARYAERVFTQTPEMDPNSLSADLARRALLADPTASAALTVLGSQAQLRGDAKKSNTIFSYSTALSRRELRPRIWAIEEAVIRGDIAGALRNYDLALRTSKEANNLLFPTLAAALSEPRIRAELLQILASRPVWEKDFLSYVALSGIEPEGAIAMFREGRKIGLKTTDDIRANLVDALALQNKHEEAWAYYRSIRPGARRNRSRDPSFALHAGAQTVFDWQEGGDSRLAAAISREGKRGLLEFAVPPSIGGEVTSQTQLLPPGAYHFEGRSRGLNQPSRSQPYWALICLDGRELGQIAVTNSDQNDGRFSGRFIVPAGCPVQVLSLVVRPSDDIMGVTGQIDRAQLVPAA